MVDEFTRESLLEQETDLDRPPPQNTIIAKHQNSGLETDFSFQALNSFENLSNNL
ncbi:hypothetical protein [Umezakia ovalisporum]|uniref:Uncharacterized protein n=1 Tax=Umezakia ovalisporum FSS-43 TaxID=2740520 RepID=A0ABT6K7P5_9CYAN|nr:hypothetical protein [Umezakia ovalisporum]MDH6058035.1 hypothetical protein [Umezakia ovalisporum FSS-43]MDH6067817.1 hypothetical protein [Umezakia ovalisporum APH033B]MDH6071524.1 hypothetical protein [Umezakia ovalisporum CobakiLakeA]MDH6076667.1 hypothetical protein [Umezakia ovalisporum FSS-45]MDH6080864.1 hypothetical protein [Umezakia ovalisporum FSS-44]